MTDGHINRLTLALYGNKFIKVNAPCGTFFRRIPRSADFCSVIKDEYSMCLDLSTRRA